MSSDPTRLAQTEIAPSVEAAGSAAESSGAPSAGSAPSAGNLAALDLAGAVGAFEAANDRPSTPLERRLLEGIARAVDEAARAAGSDGPTWVEAAVVEAVESGSRFVAPKRVREICRRWSREGPPGRGGRSDPGHVVAAVGRRRGPDSTTRPTSDSPSPTAPDYLDAPSNQRDPSEEDDLDEALPSAPGQSEVPIFVVDPSSGLNNRQLWASVLDELSRECPPGSYGTWVRPTTLVGLDGDSLVVGAPNSYACAWLDERMRDPISRAVGRLLGRAREIRFEVEQEWLSRQTSGRW